MSGNKDTSTASLAEVDPDTAPASGKGAQEPTDETSATTAEAPGELSVEALKKQLEEARRIAGDHWEAVLRGRAELENLRKRSERELENAHKFGLERIVSELLPVKDSLELGLAAGDGDDARVVKLRQGMELTLKMLGAALEKFGVTEINPEGKEFNPEYHQAMTVQEADGQASNSVISVIQKGYSLNDRLIRPALVIVAK
ncbi:MAG: nucleotide exchange factor GrpE [Gammaproteobacteria bacterium]|nr:nucleotide exchange factor GrpE [Gammaproteobacteria bacterium]MDH3412020.1 nucleotide exchange factor GrpE [Gammaproteobacteria bacterium]